MCDANLGRIRVNAHYMIATEKKRSDDRQIFNSTPARR